MGTDHGRIIAQEAEAALGPRGFKRKGQSRVYIRDQRFWLAVVEFQPSSFARGTYLDVSAHWLWAPEPRLSSDFGGRVRSATYGGFIHFVDVAQFTREARDLAYSAGQEAEKLLSVFTSIQIVALVLAEEASGFPAERRGSWQDYNAGVAAGLTGDTETCRRMLATIIAADVSTEWHARLRGLCGELSTLAGDESAFCSRILRLIAASRLYHKLPADPDCLDKP